MTIKDLNTDNWMLKSSKQLHWSQALLLQRCLRLKPTRSFKPCFLFKNHKWSKMTPNDHICLLHGKEFVWYLKLTLSLTWVKFYQPSLRQQRLSLKWVLPAKGKASLKMCWVKLNPSLAAENKISSLMKSKKKILLFRCLLSLLKSSEPDSLPISNKSEKYSLILHSSTEVITLEILALELSPA